MTQEKNGERIITVLWCSWSRFYRFTSQKRSKNQVWCKWHSIAIAFQPCRDFITSLNFRSTRASRTMWTWTWWNVCCSLGLDLWRTEQMRKAVFLTSHGTTETPAGWILLGELVGCWNSLLLIYGNSNWFSTHHVQPKGFDSFGFRMISYPGWFKRPRNHSLHPRLSGHFQQSWDPEWLQIGVQSWYTTHRSTKFYKSLRF